MGTIGGDAVKNVNSAVLEVINERMNYVEGLATSSRSAVDSNISTLLAKIAEINMAEPPVADTTVFPNIPTATFYDIQVPDIPPIDLGDYDDPVYQEVPVPDMPPLPQTYEIDRMTLYEELSVPESELVIEDLTYITDLSDYLEAKLKAFIDNGVSGLSTTVEQAIYDRAVERKRIETVAMVTETENYFAARGFSMPPGALSGRLLEIQQQADNAMTDINNDILRMQGELAFKGTWEAMGRALELEKNKRDFFTTEIANVLDKAKTKAENLMKRVGLMLQARESRLKNEGMLADDVLKRYQMIFDYLKTTLVRVQTNAEIYKTRSQVYIANIEARLKKWEAEVKEITTTIDAKSKANAVNADIAELGIKKADLTTKAYIEKYKSTNDKYAELVKATVDAIKTVGTLYAQVASGALSAIHAGVSMSTSGGANVGYSASDSYSYSESRSQSESKQEVV